MSTIKTGTYLTIEFDRIHVLQTFQVRSTPINNEELEALSSSIVESGQQTPVWGLSVSNADFTKKFPDVPLNENDRQYILIAGFSRMAAIKMAIEKGNLPSNFVVKFDVKYKLFPSDAELLLTSTAENTARNGMTDVDKAAVIARLIKLNVKQSDIAARLGLTQAAVSTLNKFELTADVETKSLVQNGAVSFTAAKTAVEAGLNGTQLTEIVAESKVTGAKVTAEKVLVKAGQQTALQTFKNLIKEVERENMRIVGNGKHYTSNQMFVLFWDILSGDTTSKELFEIFNPENVVKETKSSKGQLVPQPNGAVGFEADDSDGEEE